MWMLSHSWLWNIHWDVVSKQTRSLAMWLLAYGWGIWLLLDILSEEWVSFFFFTGEKETLETSRLQLQREHVCLHACRMQCYRMYYTQLSTTTIHGSQWQLVNCFVFMQSGVTPDEDGALLQENALPRKDTFSQDKGVLFCRMPLFRRIPRKNILPHKNALPQKSTITQKKTIPHLPQKNTLPQDKRNALPEDKENVPCKCYQ